MRPKDMLIKWIELFNSSDAKSFSELYSEEAINHQGVKEPVIGKQAIYESFKEEFAIAEMEGQDQKDFAVVVSFM